jgi:hypothetical protein
MDEFQIITEAVLYNQIMPNKMYSNIFQLPSGSPPKHGVLISMFCLDFQKSLLWLSSGKNVSLRGQYPYAYSNYLLSGKLYGRPYKTYKNRQAIRKMIVESKFIQKQSLDTDDLNTIYDASGILSIFMQYSKQRGIGAILKEFPEIFNSTLPSLKETKQPTKKIVIINVDDFSYDINSPINELKSDPLFLLYYIIRRGMNDNILLDVDIILAGNGKTMMFNPTKISKKEYAVFSTSFFNIIKIDYNKKIKESKELSAKEKEDTINTTPEKVPIKVPEQKLSAADEAILAKTRKDNMFGDIESIKQLDSPSTSDTIIDKDDDDSKDIEELIQKVDIETDEGDDDSNDKSKDAPDDILNVIGDISVDEIDDIDDEEVIDLNDIDAPTKVIKKPKMKTKQISINSARDIKLRQSQERIRVKDQTVSQHRKTTVISKAPDKAEHSVMKTTNQNMKKSQFETYNEQYAEKYINTDIVNIISNFDDKSTRLYVEDIQITDSSDALNAKETWQVKYKDELGKTHNLKFDIPKIIEGKFTYLSGNDQTIQNQNMMLPLVKTGEDTVQIVTNYNKIFFMRNGSKSSIRINKLFKLASISEYKGYFKASNSKAINLKYASSLEFDEIGQSYYSFKHGKCSLYFNREAPQLKKIESGKLNVNEFLIGVIDNTPVIVNSETGLTREGKTIIKTIYDNLPMEAQFEYDKVKESKTNIYVYAKLMNMKVPVIVLLSYWEGLTKVLEKAGTKYRFESFEENGKRATPAEDENVLKFADGIFYYNADIKSELLLNGLKVFGTSGNTFESMNSPETYMVYLVSVYKTYRVQNTLLNFYEFMIDPITKECLNTLRLPEDIVGLAISAVYLLGDNAYKTENNDDLYRIRKFEIIPAILYKRLAQQYTVYKNTGGRQKLTLPQDAIIKDYMELTTVEDYSTLNPVSEVDKLSAISPKGFSGLNLDQAYNEIKRSYHPSMVGKNSMTSSPDAGVGIKRNLTMDPKIVNMRGMRDPNDCNIEDMKDTQLFSMTELITPGIITHDDATRSSFSVKQTCHSVPMDSASPTLLTNGADEAIRFRISSKFAINAKTDGRVVERDDDTGMIVVQYKPYDAKKPIYQAFSISPNIVKNGGGGMYLNNQLQCDLKVGDTFKKDECLAYHDKYFTKTKFGDVRYNLGVLARVAIYHTSESYEDGNFCSEDLSERMTTHIVYMEQIPLGRNANIVKMLNVGDHVDIGDYIIEHDTSFEDKNINKLLAKLNSDLTDVLEDTTKTGVKTTHAGIITKIRIYSSVEASQCSPSIQSLMKRYNSKIEKKERILNKYDKSIGIIKAGYLNTETTETIKSKYGKIKGVETDILIEVYIDHPDSLAFGDKIVSLNCNKHILGNIIENDMCPFPESDPTKKIDMFCSPGPLAKRMLTSSGIHIAANRCLIELKEALQKIAES